MKIEKSTEIFLNISFSPFGSLEKIVLALVFKGQSAFFSYRFYTELSINYTVSASRRITEIPEFLAQLGNSREEIEALFPSRPGSIWDCWEESTNCYIPSEIYTENFKKLIWKIYDVIFSFKICMNFDLKSSWIFDVFQKALKCNSRNKLYLIF